MDIPGSIFAHGTHLSDADIQSINHRDTISRRGAQHQLQHEQRRRVRRLREVRPPAHARH
ncbi:MAG: hypothetical protein R3C45_13170 [Phycisphaerales bacterium]